MRRLLYEVLVGGPVHEGFAFGRVGGLHLEEPALLEGGLVQQGGLAGDGVVHGGYLAGHRGVDVESGFYRLRVIYDLNGDGVWTSGDFDSGRQPEPVSYYPGEIEIKKGWEVDQKWDIGTKNIKDQKMRTIKKKQ